MKKCILLVIAALGFNSAIAQTVQTPTYYRLVRQADSLYNAKDYKHSALTYSAAFKANGWKASINDRYDAACSWALANNPDSAFSNLKKSGFTDYEHLSTDADLISLHTDKRWPQILSIVKTKQEKAEANYNKPLYKELTAIFDDDQTGRQQIEVIDNKYGRDSKEMKALWADIAHKDSIDLIKVKTVLDKYGWLGSNVVGDKGNAALFLVIQHAEKADRDKYLPMMRDAVKRGNASGANLALMEDRSALESGKKQIYGSQIGRDMKTGKYYIDPIEDEANVDKRRATVGLGPLADYAAQWNIIYQLPKQ
jgi:hypothetical protein